MPREASSLFLDCEDVGAITRWCREALGPGVTHVATDARGLVGGPFVSRGNTWLSSQGGSEAGLPQPSVVHEEGVGEAADSTKP